MWREREREREREKEREREREEAIIDLLRLKKRRVWPGPSAMLCIPRFIICFKKERK